jgi:putative SOS response-associated peptidase YedK
MCGRTSTPSLRDGTLIANRFALSTTDLPEYDGNVNTRPGTYNPLVIEREQPDGQRQRVVELMKWGLVPVWAKEPRVKGSTINARAATIAELPTYKVPFKRWRGIVIVDGFYEWREEGGAKVPYRFSVTDDELFGLGAVYSVWYDKTQPDAPPLLSYSIITLTPNELVKQVHPKAMPFIVPMELEAAWLGKNTDEGLLHAMMVPYPADQMEMRRAEI